ncbi:MAG: CAP domain-containing protein [Bacillota bacterium]
MKKRILACKRIVVVLLVVGLLLGLSAPISAQTVDIKTRPGGNADIYELVVNDQVVMRFRSIPNGLSAFDRSNIIQGRLQGLADKGQLNTNTLGIKVINGCPALVADNQIIATVTNADLLANGSTLWGLLNIWNSNFKKALENLQPVQPPKQVEPPKPAPNPNPDPAPQPGKPDEGKPSQPSILTADEQKMLNLVNQERTKAGLQPLTVHPELVKLARLKSEDMIKNKYFAHQSPTYGSPFDMMKAAGIKYSAAGENLAGAPTVETAHTNLMNSSGHRANILNAKYTHIGIGIVDGGPYGKMFTQMFIRQ